MKDHYSAAEQIARTSQQAAGTANAFYPAMNRIAAELAREGGTRRQPKPDAEDLENVRRSMSAAPADFWSVVGQTELDMYASLRDRSLDRDMDALTAAFRKHFERISAPKMWGSVHDNAVFVLSKYQQRATKQEAKAAQRLLDALAELAGQTPSASSSRGASKPRRRKPGGSKRAASSTPRRPR
jgi:hypothetical protein